MATVPATAAKGPITELICATKITAKVHLLQSECLSLVAFSRCHRVCPLKSSVNNAVMNRLQVVF